jgi:hypothetical protein
MIWEEELKSDPSEVKNIVANFMHLAFSKSVVTAYPVVQDLTILYSRLEASQTVESFRAYIARSWTFFFLNNSRRAVVFISLEEVVIQGEKA